MALDDQSETSFSTPQGDVAIATNFWTRVDSGAAGWDNVGLCPASSFVWSSSRQKFCRPLSAHWTTLFALKQPSAVSVKHSFNSVAASKIWNSLPLSLRTCTIRYDTRYYFNVRSKADISQLNLPHGTSPDTFRRYLKTHYCQQAFHST